MEDMNLNWIKSGATGCNFATLFAKNPESIGWKRIMWDDYLINGMPEGAFIISIIMPEHWKKADVIYFAECSDFYQESTGDGLTGLRFKIGENISWVQYFGPDSHVVTRQSPQPELLFCIKLPLKHYFRVGYKGILHLAHAAVGHLTQRKADKLWETSFKTTAKKIGHSPTIEEAAKTTFKN